MAYLVRRLLAGILQAVFLSGGALAAALATAQHRPDLTLEAGVATVLLAGLMLCGQLVPGAGPPRTAPRFRERPGAVTPRKVRRTIRTAEGCVWKPVGGSMSTRLMRYGCARCGKTGYGPMGRAPLACLRNSAVPQL
ncbi:hypothetical protein BCF33_1530 [Hasllibacter halocynthiae]|uniref:Uncharacterized protein n=1 Tax=Hasllibacter halocynthiae TaxID=595589 RepID=A0A2T0X179_9RHOB|nr:hypothetical protein [Hasllibacter halocynthiae]PRY92677.1 hypothetical protein BCF33_1530 [Hasllibacter halocynthiae]